uniref:Uncharacterized protein n=1 Tax=Arundo donax TaxID=35708 RepID=A0A0A8YGM9_ARUDO
MCQFNKQITTEYKIVSGFQPRPLDSNPALC